MMKWVLSIHLCPMRFNFGFSIGQNEMSAKFQDSTDEADSWLLRDDFFTQSLVGR